MWTGKRILVETGNQSGSERKALASDSPEGLRRQQWALDVPHEKKTPFSLPKVPSVQPELIHAAMPNDDKTSAELWEKGCFNRSRPQPDRKYLFPPNFFLWSPPFHFVHLETDQALHDIQKRKACTRPYGTNAPKVQVQLQLTGALLRGMPRPLYLLGYGWVVETRTGGAGRGLHKSQPKKDVGSGSLVLTKMQRATGATC